MTSCLLSEEDLPLSRLIYHTAQVMKNFAEKRLKPFGMTIEQLMPLKILALRPGLSQRQIGEECHKTPSNLTRILDRLENKGLIERCSNPEDRRTTLIFLTAKGQELVHTVTAILDGLAAQVTHDLSEADQQIIRTSLGKMINNIENLEADVH